MMPRKFRDPDAMDVDRGKPKTARPLECFGCKGPHMKRDFPKEKGKFDKQRRINELRSQLSQLEDTLDIPVESSVEPLSEGFERATLAS